MHKRKRQCMLGAMKAFLVIAAVFMSVGLASAAESLDVLLVHYSTEMMDYVEKSIIPAYEARHNVKVNIITATYGNRTDKLMTLIAAGTPPDVMVTSGYTPTEEGSVGMLAPLDGYLAKWKNTNRYTKQLWDAVKWQGKVVVVPMNIDFRVMMYNKTLFAEAGLDPNRAPQSWDDLISYGKRLTRQEGDKISVRGINMSYLDPAHALLWFIRQIGIVELDINTFMSNLDAPEAAAAAQALADIYDAGQRSIASTGRDYAAYGEGIAALTPGRLLDFKKNNQQDIIDSLGIFSPRYKPNTTPVSHAFINGVSILAASKKKDLAWEFIAAMNEDEHVFNIQKINGWISGRLDLAQRMLPLQPKIDLMYNQFQYLQSPLIPPPRTNSQPPLGNAMNKIYKKELSPQAALADVHAIWTGLMADWKAKVK